MKKSSFTGWRSVLSFSVQQITEGVAFKVATAIISILLIAGMIIVNCVLADKSQDNIVMIDKVFVLDESGLAETPFSQLLPMFVVEKYDGIQFETAAPDKQLGEVFQDAISYSEKAVVLHISKEISGYGMQIAIPGKSVIKEDEANSLLNHLVQCFKSNKLTQIGLTEDKLQVVMKPVDTVITEIGEADKSVGEFIIEMLAPMLLSLVLYLMIYQYGAKACSAIVTEKTSKLMELLLTSVHPISLIMGKILATTLVGIFQFFIWIISGVLGYIIGDKIAVSMYPGYENPLYNLFQLMKENTTEGVFEIPAIILGISILCLGFLFYCVIAGGIGAMLSKPEQVAVGAQIFVLPLTIGWGIAYFGALSENTVLLNIIRLVPFTAPFTVPAELIIGSMSITMGCITLLILLLTTMFFIIITGRLYKGLIFYNGSKLTPARIWGILK